MSKLKFSWIISEQKIEVIFTPDFDPHFHHVDLFNHLNEKLEVVDTEIYSDCLVLNTPEKLDFSKNYYVTCQGEKLFSYFRRDVLDGLFCYDGKLGPEIIGSKISLTYWNPVSTETCFVLYDKSAKANAELKELKRVPMVRGEKGEWTMSYDASELGIGDLHNYLYKIEVTNFGQKVFVLDPYAKSMPAHTDPNYCDAMPGALIDLNRTDPTNFSQDTLKNTDIMETSTDFVAQEIHVRDFTIARSSQADKPMRGTYLGFCKKIPHLKKLGISHVQLMPVQSFYTVNETVRTYQNESVPRDQINYNWGYDVHHYFIPSGWFATDANTPDVRIKELKTMIQRLHEAKIGVIMDVVYNHNYKREFLENAAPGCYLRRTREGYISGFTGAGDSLESRNYMCRRLIIDSLKYYVNEFHVNGFRFDLMGFMDKETMRQMAMELGDEVILYGEAWEFTDLPYNEAMTKRALHPMLPIGAFNDSVRNAYVGDKGDRGFVQSNTSLGPLTKTGIIGALRNYPTDYDDDGHLDVFLDEFDYHQFAYRPEQCINYLSIHDGFTLWDKINISTPEDMFMKAKIYKMALAMLLTSQGRVVLESGVEMYRTKRLTANDPNPDRAFTSDYASYDNSEFYKFHENSYRSCDITNMYDWERYAEFKDGMPYVQGLIKLRKKFSCLRYDTAEKIKKHLHFICENIPNTPRFDIKNDTRIVHWNEVKELNINFINGPFKQTMYIIGSKGTVSNAEYPVSFDSNGNAIIHLSDQMLKDFHIGNAGDFGGFEFKLSWDKEGKNIPVEYYTNVGSNCIFPWSISKGHRNATIDLSIKNHTAGVGDIKMNKHIAYTLDVEGTENEKLIVVHNTSKHYNELDVPLVNNYAHRDILVDNLHAGTEPLSFTAVKINGTTLKVPGKTSTVIYLH